MRYFLHLSLEHGDLPAAEARALLGLQDVRRVGQLLFFEHDDEKLLCALASRLAFARGLYRFLFSSSVSGLASAAAGFDWSSSYRRSFCVRLHGSPQGVAVADVAGVVWRALKRPVVDLERPGSHFDFFYFQKEVFAGLRLLTIPAVHHEKFLNHPTSLDPRLARAVVNLTGIRSGVVVDPFCGVGGILIEAARMGLRPVGYDISEVMVSASRKNLAHLRLRSARVERSDATKLKGHIAFLATDPPYGKNTSTKDIGRLYNAFLRSLSSVLGRRAVIVFPHWSKYRPMVRRSGLIIVGEYPCYVHKSLTRMVVVVETARKKKIRKEVIGKKDLLKKSMLKKSVLEKYTRNDSIRKELMGKSMGNDSVRRPSASVVRAGALRKGGAKGAPSLFRGG